MGRRRTSTVRWPLLAAATTCIAAGEALLLATPGGETHGAAFLLAAGGVLLGAFLAVHVAAGDDPRDTP